MPPTPDPGSPDSNKETLANRNNNDDDQQDQDQNDPGLRIPAPARILDDPSSDDDSEGDEAGDVVIADSVF